MLLLPAGVETTYRSLGNLLFALLNHPDQLEQVIQRPELRPAAIEEGLRWETPVVTLVRQCVRNTSLAGLDVPAGRGLNVFLASANRDERRYPDADRFDIHRSPPTHVSFGSGPHMCLGMHLPAPRSPCTAAQDPRHPLSITQRAPRPVPHLNQPLTAAGGWNEYPEGSRHREPSWPPRPNHPTSSRLASPSAIASRSPGPRLAPPPASAIGRDGAAHGAFRGG